MRKEVGKLIKEAVRDIESLLGPSFPIGVFCKALLSELRLRDVDVRIFAYENGVFTIQADTIILWVADQRGILYPGQLSEADGIWVPHDHLILPERKAVA